MDSRGNSSSRSGGHGAPEQLHELCRHILIHGIGNTEPQLERQLEERVKASYHTAILLLNKSQSAQEDTMINEFSVAEKIKKYLVSSVSI